MGSTNVHLRLARAALENGNVPAHERAALLEIVEGVQSLCTDLTNLNHDMKARFANVDDMLTRILNKVGGYEN